MSDLNYTYQPLTTLPYTHTVPKIIWIPEYRPSLLSHKEQIWTVGFCAGQKLLHPWQARFLCRYLYVKQATRLGRVYWNNRQQQAVHPCNLVSSIFYYQPWSCLLQQLTVCRQFRILNNLRNTAQQNVGIRTLDGVN